MDIDWKRKSSVWSQTGFVWKLNKKIYIQNLYFVLILTSLSYSTELLTTFNISTRPTDQIETQHTREEWRLPRGRGTLQEPSAAAPLWLHVQTSQFDHTDSINLWPWDGVGRARVRFHLKDRYHLRVCFLVTVFQVARRKMAGQQVMEGLLWLGDQAADSRYSNAERWRNKEKQLQHSAAFSLQGAQWLLHHSEDYYLF